MSRLVTKQKPNFQPSECQICWLQICHTSGLLFQVLLTLDTRTHTQGQDVHYFTYLQLWQHPQDVGLVMRSELCCVAVKHHLLHTGILTVGFPVPLHLLTHLKDSTKRMWGTWGSTTTRVQVAIYVCAYSLGFTQITAAKCCT